jgi:hypothetical protein
MGRYGVQAAEQARKASDEQGREMARAQLEAKTGRKIFRPQETSERPFYRLDSPVPDYALNKLSNSERKRYVEEGVRPIGLSDRKVAPKD